MSEIHLTLEWDSPYSPWCKRGKLLEATKKNCLLTFKTHDDGNGVDFVDRDSKRMSWAWSNDNAASLWPETYSGRLLNENGVQLAETKIARQDSVRANGALHKTLLELTCGKSHYTLNWELILWLRLISAKDVMSLCDETGEIVMKSVTPSAYNRILILRQTEYDDVLLPLFVAYHLRIPMDCIGD